MGRFEGVYRRVDKNNTRIQDGERAHKKLCADAAALRLEKFAAKVGIRHGTNAKVNILRTKKTLAVTGRGLGKKKQSRCGKQ